MTAWNPALAKVECARRSGRIASIAHLEDIARAVVGRAYESSTRAYRELVAQHGKDDKRCKAVKTQDFPAIVVGGLLPVNAPRISSMPNPHSELVQGDYDSLGPDLLEKASRFPAAAFTFVSPSRALKVLIRVTPAPATAEEHTAAWEDANRALSAYLGVPFDEEADKSVKSVNGLCFLCHSPDAVLNTNADAVSWTLKPPPEPPVKPVRTAQAFSPAVGEDDLEAAMQFLARTDVGDGICLAVGGTLKALGRPLEEWQAWAAAAGCHCQEQLARKWSGFQWHSEPGNIIGAAVRRGWEKPRKPRRPIPKFRGAK